MSIGKYGEDNDVSGFLSKDSPFWHRKAYSLWKHLWERIYSRLEWFGCQIHPDLKKFSNFLRWLENEPLFEEFKKTCKNTKWTVDKDIKVKGNRNYYPEFMILCTGSINSKDCCARNGSPLNKLNAKKPRIGIPLKEDSPLIILKSVYDGKEKGFDCSNITKCCNKKYKSHKGYKWFYLSYKHNKILRIYLNEKKDGCIFK